MSASAKSTRNKHFIEIADSLNEHLPVALTASDAERNPEFVKLLESLTQHIEPMGASVSTHHDLSQAKELLDCQKRRWLLNHTLLTELHELLLDHRLKAMQSPPPADSQFYKTADEMLTYAEIGDYVSSSLEPGSDVTLLGLTTDKLDRINPYKKHKQSMQQRLIPDIESRLRSRCEALVSFHVVPAGGTTADSGRFDFAKASQLPGILDVETKLLAEEKQGLQKDIARTRKLSARYRELMLESSELVVRLLVNHRLKSQPEFDTINSEWLAARCDAMCLKIRVLELQLLYDTYHPQAIQALNTVKSELDKSIATTEHELSRTTQALRAYESVGTAFDSVVQDFTRLTAEVENRRWALHELKKYPVDGTTAAGAGDQTFFS